MRKPLAYTARSLLAVSTNMMSEASTGCEVRGPNFSLLRGTTLTIRRAVLAWALCFPLVMSAAPEEKGGQERNPPRDSKPSESKPSDNGSFVEQLKAARAAFDAGDFAAAAAGFSALQKAFGENPLAMKAIDAHKSLHAIALANIKSYDEALPVIAAALAVPETTIQARDLLAYLQGFIYFELGKWPEAFVALNAYFDKSTHNRQRRLEAMLMAGACLQKEEKHAEAAAYFAKVGDRIRQAEPVTASRVDLLELQSLLAADDLDGALQAVRDGYEKMALQPQIITFQFLTLDLGNRLLNEERWLDAIVCFQRIWSRDRLLRHQGDRLAQWQRDRAVAEGQPDAAVAVPRLDAMISGVEAEIKMLESNPEFDASVRYRLASAFLQHGRHAEAAAILEAMLADLPPEPIVEQSALPLLQCWLQAKRWEKTVACADLYEERFGKLEINASHPDILLLKSQAQENDYRFLEAAQTCADIVERFPDSPAAVTAGFKHGYLLLMADQSEEGLEILRDYTKKFPDSSLSEDAAYWSGEALSSMEKHEEAREVLAKYLSSGGKKNWRGEYNDAAMFRRAYSLFSMAKYEESIKEFNAFLKAHPKSDYVPEAHLLAGDALCGVGKIDEGIASYGKIALDANRFYEEGIFKAGKALRLQNKLPETREHFTTFLKSHPKSGRAAEAVHWIAWTWQQAGETQKARDTAWEAVQTLGTDPNQLAVEDILDALAKMYRTDTETGNLFMRKLREIIDSRPAEGPDVLACRARWARARFIQATDSTQFRTEMMEASRRLDAANFPPRLSVDIALAIEGFGFGTQAEQILITTRKWFPRTMEKGRIFAGLLRIAAKRGDTEAAFKAIAKFEKEAISPPAKLKGEVLLTKVDLLTKAGKKEEALEVLKSIQADRTLGARTRANAFFEAGQILSQSDPTQAAPFYERVYVAYSAFSDIAAKAYIARAECLERIGMPDKAKEVYQELVNREDMTGETEAVGIARKKLEETL